jgi:alanyl-tRNA synthetase
VTDDLVKTVQAGKVVGAVAKIVGGGGGGRPHMAQAGGKDPSKLDAALQAVPEIVREMMG